MTKDLILGAWREEIKCRLENVAINTAAVPPG